MKTCKNHSQKNLWWSIQLIAKKASIDTHRSNELVEWPLWYDIVKTASNFGSTQTTLRCRFFYIFSVSQVFTNEYKSLLNLVKAVFVLIRSSEKTTRKGIKNIRKKSAMQKICVNYTRENLQFLFKCWHIHIAITDSFSTRINPPMNCFSFKAIIIIINGLLCRLVVWHKIYMYI